MGRGELGAGQSGEPGWSTPGLAGGGSVPVVDLVAEVQQQAMAFGRDAEHLAWSQQLVAMRRHLDRLEAVWLAQAAHFEAGGGSIDDGAPSLAAWFRHRCRISPAEANGRAAMARTMISGRFPALSAAMSDGAISWRHGEVVARTLKDVPNEHRHAAVELLVEPARSVDPMLLKRLGQELLHRLDADRAEQAAIRRLERRGLDVAETFDGMVAVHGLLDPVAGATLPTAIDAKVRPSRGDLDDERSWSQRRADALTDITREWLDLGDSPQVGGQRPHLSVIVELATLRNEAGASPAALEFGGAITAEQARLIACDANVSRVITDGDSHILDVGRATRTIPPGLRRAIVARDRQCIADSCRRPSAHCDVHHIKFWEDGGGADLGNLVLLCRRHHGFVHQRRWRVVEQRDGAMRLLPPRSQAPP